MKFVPDLKVEILTFWERFSSGQMVLQLTKIIFTYEMELIDQDLDWIQDCKMHFLWWKPELNVRFTPVIVNS